MAEREVRYCTTEDGVRIAYCVEGEGPPLVVSPIFITSFSLVHLVPKFEHMLSRVGEGRQLVQYDMRGTGLSQREVGDLNYGATLRDMEAVVRTLGLKRFSLLGMGIDRVRRLPSSSGRQTYPGRNVRARSRYVVPRDTPGLRAAGARQLGGRQPHDSGSGPT